MPSSLTAVEIMKRCFLYAVRAFSEVVYLAINSDLHNTLESYETVENIFPNSREVYIIISGSYPNRYDDYRSRFFLSLSHYLIIVENSEPQYF